MEARGGIRPEGCTARSGKWAPGPGRKISLGAGSCDSTAMTQYTRSVIPGRPQPDDRPHDGELDRMVFGRAPPERAISEPDTPARASRRAEPMPDDDAPPEHLFTERLPRERRKSTPRRKTEYAPLPSEAGNRPVETSNRGPLILIVTTVVLGVFGAVVWNAYSSGLRAPDGGPTPELASAGPFKSRPAADASKPADIDASVFERVASSRNPSEPATTPEVRPEVVPEAIAPAKLEAKPEPRLEAIPPAPAKLEPSKPAPVKTDAMAGSPIKLAPAPTVPGIIETAHSPPKPAPAASATPAPIVKPAKPVQPPAKPLATTPKTPVATADATVPAAPALDGAGAFRPAFAATGAYVVQLAAPSTEAAAQAEWVRRAKAAPGLLGAAEKMVIQADVNGKTVYRLRAGSFAASSDADAFCTAIKATGGACFTAKK
jgi:SPOR domain